MSQILGNNYNYSIGHTLNKKKIKELKGNHRCNMCRKVGPMQYSNPYLCEYCAIELSNGGLK